MSLEILKTTSHAAARLDHLNCFFQTFKKGYGYVRAFKALDPKDRTLIQTFLGTKKLPYVHGNKGRMLKKHVQTLLKEATHQILSIEQIAKNHLHKIHGAPALAHITPFLAPQDLVFLQCVSKETAKLGDAAHIITSYDLAPLIERYCNCKLGEKKTALEALTSLMSLVQELSKFEGLEPPPYRFIKEFFSFVEARNLLRLTTKMHKPRPLPGFNSSNLQLEGNYAEILLRATAIRTWFAQHRAILARFRELDLNHQRLTLLPPEVGQLENLTTLNANHNQLVFIPPELGCLTSLRDLGLRNNCLPRIPKELGQLLDLVWIDLNNNRISDLPGEIGNLRALIWLSLDHNRLTDLPEEISQLWTLSAFSLSDNLLTYLPKKIGKLTALRSLGLSQNRLTKIPEEICLLKRLTSLFLSNNRLTRLPKGIHLLKALTHLSFDNNRITHIPKGLCKLSSLVYLSFCKNRLENVPKELSLLKQLVALNMSHNRLSYIPEELWQIFSSSKKTNISIFGNGIVDLPVTLQILKGQLTAQNKKFQTITLLKRMGDALKKKHDCHLLAKLLEQMEYYIGKEMCSKLYHCLYDICKKETAFHKRVKDPNFGQLGFVDPHIHPKFKAAAFSLFWKRNKGSP